MEVTRCVIVAVALRLAAGEIRPPTITWWSDRFLKSKQGFRIVPRLNQ